MEAAAYEEMFALEDHHWWFRGRRRRMAPMLAEALAELGPAPRLLEVGCGTGGNLAHLVGPTGARSIGIDLDAGALRFCRERFRSTPDDQKAPALLRANGLQLPIASQSIDCVLASDIIEHFDDEAALVAELLRVLRPGGQLVASVPQYPSLWSPHDEFLHHKRRYKSGQLEEVLRNAGFDVQSRMGFNFLLLPPIALVRRIRSARAKEGQASTDFFSMPRGLNAAMGGLFVLESWIAKAVRFPQGVSLFVRAKRSR